MKDLFNKIYETRSFNVIQSLVQDAIQEDSPTGNDLMYLEAILEEDDLDSIYVLALLGARRIDEADKLQIEVAAFRKRKADQAARHAEWTAIANITA